MAVWPKQSFGQRCRFEGLILHATSTASDLLGQPAEDVVGQSFFSLLPGGDNGPPTTAFVESDPSSPVAKVAAAFRSATTNASRRGGVPVQHKMVKKSGAQVDVLTIFYPPKAGDLTRSDSDASSPTSDDSRQSSSSGSLHGIRPTSLVVQIKSVPSINQPGSSIASATNARPLAQAGDANLFEELETTRGTSWQYELHQLRVLNRRLKEQIDGAKRDAAKNGGKAKVKKRKAGDEMGPPGQSQAQAVPEQFLGSSQTSAGSWVWTGRSRDVFALLLGRHLTRSLPQSPRLPVKIFSQVGFVPFVTNRQSVTGKSPCSGFVWQESFYRSHVAADRL